MKISDLKQPYRRMAEYLAKSDDKNNLLSTAFIWENTDDLVWRRLYYGIYSPITEEIKTHFPADFDFSGEEGKNVNQNFRYISDTMLLDDILPLVFNKIGSLNSSEFNEWFNSDFLRFLFDKKHFIAKNNNELYTQLAKEGRFGELPETCEFSEPVELDVWDDDKSFDLRKITGKFKGNYMDIHCIGWKNAQLPTKKIDFSQFKSGDVVEVEYYGDEGNENIVGYIHEKHDYSIHISSKMSVFGEREIILTQNIKSITKVK